MKRLSPDTAIVLALALAAMPTAAAAQAHAAPDACDKVQGQSNLNICYGKESILVDQQLTRVYQELLQKLNLPEQRKLRQVERAWVQYRSLQCDQVSAKYQGGSMQPMASSQCSIQLAEARTKELRDTYSSP